MKKKMKMKMTNNKTYKSS